MIRIGDFARLARVSVATLRHYDEIGLLKPVSVDGTTGYRYYSAKQLTQISRILVLKDLGFSLVQIGQVIEGISVEQLVGMLKMKRAQCEQSLVEEQDRLSRIAALLRQIEREEIMSDYNVVLKLAQPIRIASCRVRVPTNDEVPKYLGAAFDAAYGLVRARGEKELAPCLAIWHQPAAVLADEDVEAAVPVERLFEGNDRVKVYELPAVEVASVVHAGEYSGFSQAHAALLSWLESNGYRSAGPIREIYIEPAGHGSREPVTEIQYPVEKLARSVA
jgi:DNA-binding transcriptional MerR regulator